VSGGFIARRTTAARFFISYYPSDRRELINAEIVPELAASGHAGPSLAVMALHERYSDAGFARGMPDAGEFFTMIWQIRAMVTGV
jgi:hypothetical protein